MGFASFLRVVCCLTMTVCSGCGSSAGPGPEPTQNPSPATTPKIFMVVLENQSYEHMVGNPNMPYLNSLITTKASADSYYANTHPSIGNYFMFTTGQIITNDDSFASTIHVDNLVRQLIAANRTWHVYAESLPAVGYTGGNTGAYVKRHNPFAYFSDVVGTMHAQSLLPFTHFESDVASNTTADFNYLLPNQHNNMHDCPAGMSSCTDTDKMKTADAWLKAKLAIAFNDKDFRSRGLVIITLDESLPSDKAHGGGHIVTVFAGPKAKDAHRSTVLYQHQNMLRLLCDLLGCPGKPGASADAASMNEFLK